MELLQANNDFLEKIQGSAIFACHISMREGDTDPIQDPALREALERVLANSESLPDEARIRTLWADVARRAGLELRSPIASQRRVFKGQTLRQTVWLAGAITAFILVLALGWTAGVRHVIGRVAHAASVYTTRAGERGDIMLPDGSRVALSVASRLEVPANYMAGNRTVRLTGEALFTVSHHTGAPFTVLAGGTNARVLGTSFVVRHYMTDPTTTIAVRDGKVAVRTVVLTAGRQVVIHPTGILQVQPARPSQFTFAAGILTLDSMPLAEAIIALDRWYDVDIRVQGPALSEQQIKGEFAVGSVADLANILELTFNVRVVRNGRVLMLYPQGK